MLRERIKTGKANLSPTYSKSKHKIHKMIMISTLEISVNTEIRTEMAMI